MKQCAPQSPESSAVIACTHLVGLTVYSSTALISCIRFTKETPTVQTKNKEFYQSVQPKVYLSVVKLYLMYQTLKHVFDQSLAYY